MFQISLPRLFSSSFRPNLISRKFSLVRISPSFRSFSSDSNSLQSRLESKLRNSFSPSHLSVEDTSGGCGAFFRLEIVSKNFEGISMVKQHRAVNELLKEEIKGIHGLTLATYSESQFQKLQLEKKKSNDPQ